MVGSPVWIQDAPKAPGPARATGQGGVLVHERLDHLGLDKKRNRQASAIHNQVAVGHAVHLKPAPVPQDVDSSEGTHEIVRVHGVRTKDDAALGGNKSGARPDLRQLDP